MHADQIVNARGCPRPSYLNFPLPTAPENQTGEAGASLIRPIRARTVVVCRFLHSVRAVFNPFSTPPRRTVFSAASCYLQRRIVADSSAFCYLQRRTVRQSYNLNPVWCGIASRTARGQGKSYFGKSYLVLQLFPCTYPMRDARSQARSIEYLNASVVCAE
jgi:hypothetical protein